MPTPALDQVDRYLRHLEEERHLMPVTVSRYREELALLVHRGVALTSEGLAGHIARTSDGRALAPRTRNRRLAIIRGFTHWLVEVGAIPSDPTLGLRRVRVPANHDVGLTLAEVGRVAAVLRAEPASWRRTRDEAILALLFYTGLRVTELHRLDLAQVDLGRGLLLAAVRKGGGLTDLVLAPPAARALASWLSVRPASADSAVFVGGAKSTSLSVRAIQKRLRQLGEKAGLGARLHPHALRHAHATALLRTGSDIEIVRRSMNHSSIATTSLYLHSDQDLLRRALSRLPDILEPGTGQPARTDGSTPNNKKPAGTP